MVAITVPPAPHQPMPPTSSQAYLHGHHHHNDASTHPAQPSPSQRFLSQMLPVQAPQPYAGDARPPQPGPSYAHSPPRVASASSCVDTAHQASPLPASSLHTTPHRASLRLSHPPPAPSSSYLHQITPQCKRTRLSNHDADSTTTATATSPLSPSSSTVHHSNASSAATAPLSSPSLPTVRPLSGISRPFPVPATPSRPQHPSSPTIRHAPLIPMPQRSIEDFEKLLPPRPPPTTRPPHSNGPHRALLQAIPPQPPQPIPAPRIAAPLDHDLLAPAVETLSRRQGWSLTGFRSFDLDLVRIAEVVQLEQARLHPNAIDQHDYPSTSHDEARADRPHFGLEDRGLPSGSIVEVLGPPGSGKSSLVLQFAVTERLRALRRARESLVAPDDEAGPSRQLLADSCYFSEEFWDAEVASADQVLLIDCEGALSPERIADAVWTLVTSLWASLRDRSPSENGTDADRHPGPSTTLSPPQQQRSAMPEEVRRLVAAVLAGIHVSRVTSLASLFALLHSLRPTDELPEGQLSKAIPTALPPRTSLVAIDSLSYFLRSAGGSSQDRKAAAQVTERVREMLLRLQKPFEYRPPSEPTPECRQALRRKCAEAASKLCAPTIVFSNQLGIRRARNDSDANGRASPSGRPFMGAGPSRSLHKGNARSEGSSMLAPLLNGTRPPQPTRRRDERPAPSVALNGPEMWDDEEPPASSPRPQWQQQQQQQIAGRNMGSQQMGHDRGWPPSLLGQDVWRMLLFRHGAFGHRYAQMVSVPPAVQSELSVLWAQTRERVNDRARNRPAAANEASEEQTSDEAGDAGDVPMQQSTEAQQDGPPQTAAPTQRDAGEKQDKQMLELLSQLRASLFRWRPFHVSSYGLVS
ncbi:uncharacterized protein SRS1_13546 [Sporisorium reilianum f. sp. reilianum]|uniref:Uncharacterized protein n=1 Tax=Sporisorium reilianum f. sp. reilianum TaxID=72559 RepID=A0A2N8UMK8_9BASI|nr:uncharacterized protein SRS1_13546 [Sporisorium reilianum f. sp. reilianum]